MDVSAYDITTAPQNEIITILILRLRIISLFYLQGKSQTKDIRWYSFRSILRRLNVWVILIIARYAEILLRTSRA